MSASMLKMRASTLGPSWGRRAPSESHVRTSGSYLGRSRRSLGLSRCSFWVLLGPPGANSKDFEASGFLGTSWASSLGHLRG
eukprot:2867287-Pyramimonas_sp.AAC.1